MGTQAYDAFGATRSQTGVQLAFTYTGEQLDPESGLFAPTNGYDCSRWHTWVTPLTKRLNLDIETSGRGAWLGLRDDTSDHFISSAIPGRRLALDTSRRAERKHSSPSQVRKALDRIRALPPYLNGRFPEPWSNSGYWHSKAPVAEAWTATLIDAASRRPFVQAYLDAIMALRALRPATQPEARVLVLIALPDLFDSGLHVFYDTESYLDFIDRPGPMQTWTRLPVERNLLRELQLPSAAHVVGFAEQINDTDDGYVHTRELWFIGDVD